MISTSCLVLAFISVKRNDQPSDNKIVKVLAICWVLSAIVKINTLFGNIGSNPAFSMAYIVLEITQYHSPNFEPEDKAIFTHYWWAYLFAPLLGAFLGAACSSCALAAPNEVAPQACPKPKAKKQSPTSIPRKGDVLILQERALLLTDVPAQN